VKVNKKISLIQAAQFMTMAGVVPIEWHAYGPRALMTQKGRINAKIRARRKK